MKLHSCCIFFLLAVFLLTVAVVASRSSSDDEYEYDEDAMFVGESQIRRDKRQQLFGALFAAGGVFAGYTRPNRPNYGSDYYHGNPYHGWNPHHHHHQQHSHGHGHWHNDHFDWFYDD